MRCPGAGLRRYIEAGAVYLCIGVSERAYAVRGPQRA